jgi:hydrogenase maturation protease
MSRLIVGLGSPHGDDRAGWGVIDELQRRGVSADIARLARHPADLWNWCDPSTDLVICDACQGTGPVGTTRRWQWPDEPMTERIRQGTHDLPLAEVLALGRLLQSCPPTVVLWTIEGAAFFPETDLSPMVRAAVDRVADELCRNPVHA